MVVSDTTLARIRRTRKKAKTAGLTEEEIAERDRLRQEYLRNFRQKFRSQLEQIQIPLSRTAASHQFGAGRQTTEKNLKKARFLCAESTNSALSFFYHKIGKKRRQL